MYFSPCRKVCPYTTHQEAGLLITLLFATFKDERYFAKNGVQEAKNPAFPGRLGAFYALAGKLTLKIVRLTRQVGESGI